MIPSEAFTNNIFNCAGFNNTEYKDRQQKLYCVMAHIVMLTAIVLLILTAYQFVVHTRYLKMRMSSHRVLTFGLSIVFLVHSFLHYAFMGFALKRQTIFLIEIQKNILFCLVFYFYMDKAYTLLGNHQAKRRCL